MLHSLFIILLFLFQPFGQNKSDLEGRWSGSIEINDESLRINIIFSYSDGILDGSLDIPQQNAFNLPVEVTGFEGDLIEFQFQTGTGPAIFSGRLYNGEPHIIGEYEQLGEKFPFTLKKRPSVEGIRTGMPEEDILIETRAGQINGSLILTEPESPIIILLSGSGAQDRDENVAGFRVFRELSGALYNHGFSSFRYDDRGIGRSQGEQDATIYDLGEDLKDVMRHLKMNYGDRFSGFVLIGHSQGGMVSTLAANSADLNGIIFMASPFLRGDEIINEQIIRLSENSGVTEEVLETNLNFQQRIYDVVRSEGDWTTIEQDLSDRLEEQINQLPEQQRAALGDMSSFIQSQVDRQLSAAKSRWFKSMIEFETADYISKIDVPMLALFGEKDMQVVAQSNRTKAEELKSEFGLKLDVIVIEEANHLFQKANTGMPGEYGMLERSFAAGFIDSIINWLQELD
ncbi:MAG: alpha/beta hydrolase [Balneolaceae bacterium]|nr:alpha/beta hydrolase [Balneolaceae bacterium]